MNLRALIYLDDPYAQFNHQDYPLDLAGWNSDYPNFETMIEQIRPRLIIEVGSWKGASAIHMARLLQQKGIPGHILCIDTWLGSLNMWLRKEDPRFYPSLRLRHGYPTVYYQFLANVKHCGLQELIIPLPQTSLTAARWLQTHQIAADLIYIDASHDEEDVTSDLTHYWPLVNPGGAMFGDDYSGWESVRKAVDKFGRESNLEVKPRGNQWVIYKESTFGPNVAPAVAVPEVSGLPHPLIEPFLANPTRPQPLLSVVIPCYNTAPYLRQCLDSVLNQTYPNIEIIVSDDASADESPAIIREYEALYPGRVKGVFGDQNRGVGFARNQGVAQAQGEYLTFLDSDDYYYDRRKLEYELALVLAYREEKGQEVIACSEVVVVDEAGRYLSQLGLGVRLKQGQIFEDVLTLACLPRDFVIRRANFLSCDEYRPWRVYEDWDMRIRLAARYEFYTTGINGTAWRQRHGSLSTGRYFSALHRLWPVFCDNLERLVVDEQQKEELAYRFDLTLNEIRNGGGAGTEVRVLRVACAERLHLINELHRAAQERLELIERQQAELVAKEALIKKLASTHPGVWLYRLLPQRLHRFWKRQGEIYQK